MVFIGEFQVSFTGLGRIVLPKKIRELLKGNSFIVTKGFDKCLAGFDKQDWEDRANELLQVSLLEQENLDKRRFVFSSASSLEIDEQGRFVIPKNLLEFAGLSKKVVIIGVGDHFEFWDEEKWVEKSKN
ncbi:MAG: division/cell wall cluster transcriptional repressor MraZ [Microgenomates group bacterium]|jgi:MraZ protein|nr:division/cell wall cluster transcriptional repressor MraZ [Candidatus Woesebacteria bacterium]MBP6882928.1 division/cell wall cluster transcriptional repressor MraZ [Candidatus Woesebacteria bacterium]QQR63451.1 MAG: division/cell wall cluster transcriptional repressor MraZ [Candidatus Roizmanbacteria bacterium]